MTGLYRYECSNCGNVKIVEKHRTPECNECDDKYSTMMMKPSPEHDRKIMEAPPDHFKCPDCGSKLFALATEDGKDWMCRQSGGCGFAHWRVENPDIKAPNELGEEEAVRQSAWSRYKRYQKGHFEYRD